MQRKILFTWLAIFVGISANSEQPLTNNTMPLEQVTALIEACQCQGGLTATNDNKVQYSGPFFATYRSTPGEIRSALQNFGIKNNIDWEKSNSRNEICSMTKLLKHNIVALDYKRFCLGYDLLVDERADYKEFRDEINDKILKHRKDQALAIESDDAKQIAAASKKSLHVSERLLVAKVLKISAKEKRDGLAASERFGFIINNRVAKALGI